MISKIKAKNSGEEGKHSTKAEIAVSNKIDFQPKVSVIIPIYNAEKYLSECLDSVVNDNLKEIEIVCIDNDSTDNSLQILKEYASNDSRIKIIKNENNLGIFANRAKGVLAARGKYILHLDSDDELLPNIVEKVYEIAEIEQADIVHFGHIVFKEGISEEVHYENPRDAGCIFNKEIFLGFANRRIDSTPWGKLIKTKNYQKALKRLEETSNLFSQKLNYDEDYLHMLAASLFAKKYVPCSEIGYKYIQHSDSFIHTCYETVAKCQKNATDLCCIGNAIKKLLEEENEIAVLQQWQKNFQKRAKSYILHQANGIAAKRAALEKFSFCDVFTKKTILKIWLRLLSKYGWKIWDSSCRKLWEFPL